MLPQILKKYRNHISALLRDFLEQKQVTFSELNPWVTDALERLKTYVSSGKLVRGSLVIISNELFSVLHPDAVKLAAALEFIHAGLLIHDDIIDRDVTRRNLRAFHMQYYDLALTKKLIDPLHFGTSVGIGTADFLFFLGFELINSITVPQKQHDSINQVLTSELETVALAEFQDVVMAANDILPEESDILTLYRYKTGRYTFSLPLMLGGLLANQHTQVINQLEELGENLGLIFQIKDDEIGLFGNSNKTGKPVGSDIARGNKTLYYLYLTQTVTAAEKSRLSRQFGNPKITLSDIAYVRQLVKQYHIDQKINRQINLLEQKAFELIKLLPLSTASQKQLISILDFSKNRTA